MENTTREPMDRSNRDHFARPVGGFTTAEKPYRCSVCGRPVVKSGRRTFKHGEATR